jgi:hypothetical protein
VSTLTPEQARSRFVTRRVARLATIGVDGGRRVPHIVPVVFVVENDTVYSAVDAKPKRTNALRRLVNVAAEPGVSPAGRRLETGFQVGCRVRCRGSTRLPRRSPHAFGVIQAYPPINTGRMIEVDGDGGARGRGSAP